MLYKDTYLFLATMVDAYHGAPMHQLRRRTKFIATSKMQTTLRLLLERKITPTHHALQDCGFSSCTAKVILVGRHARNAHIFQSLLRNVILMQKLKTATYYPIIILGACSLAMLVLAYTALPHIIESYQSLQVRPPVLTQFLYYVTHSPLVFLPVGIALLSITLIVRSCSRAV